AFSICGRGTPPLPEHFAAAGAARRPAVDRQRIETEVPKADIGCRMHTLANRAEMSCAARSLGPLRPTTEVWGVLRLMTPTRRAGFWPLSDRVYRSLR